MNTATQRAPGAPVPTGCCPPFDPTSYHQREVVFRDEPFVKLHLKNLFFVPIGLGRQITRAEELIEAAGARPEHPLMLSEEHSPWSSDLYLQVTRPVPGLEPARLSGTFMTRVYDGPWSQMGKWEADTRRWVKGTGRTVEKVYFAYTACPSCAKAYGHNYVIVFAQIA